MYTNTFVGETVINRVTLKKMCVARRYLIPFCIDLNHCIKLTSNIKSLVTISFDIAFFNVVTFFQELNKSVNFGYLCGTLCVRQCQGFDFL